MRSSVDGRHGKMRAVPMLPGAGRRCWSFHCRHRRGHLEIWRGLCCGMALVFRTGATACGISVGYHSKASRNSRKIRDGVCRPPCPLHTANVARIPPSSTRPEAPSPAAEEREGPSKTQRKHEMHALQDLGRTLVGLDPGRLATLALPERLVDAIALLRKITQARGATAPAAVHRPPDARCRPRAAARGNVRVGQRQ